MTDALTLARNIRTKYTELHAGQPYGEFAQFLDDEIERLEREQEEANRG